MTNNRKNKRINWPSLIILIVLAVVYFSVGGGANRAQPTQTPAATAAATAAPASATEVPDLLQPGSEAATAATTVPAASKAPAEQAEEGEPGQKETVAAYIRANGSLPDYYLTKAQARNLGWSGGSVERYAPGKLIGGDRFGNFEGLLPTKQGRTYTECDINTLGKSSRGAERIVFSNDGLIFYTDDHYESFEQLEGR